MTYKVNFNVKNDLYYPGIISNGVEVRAPESVIDCLKRSDFQTVITTIKKERLSPKSFLKLSFSAELALNRAAARNNGELTFSPRHGYTVVTAVFVGN